MLCVDATRHWIDADSTRAAELDSLAALGWLGHQKARFMK
jgi:hypothetical protein